MGILNSVIEFLILNNK